MLPSINPSAICRYEKLFAATEPGIEMKVMPDMAALIIATPTMLQCVVPFLLPKNSRLPALRAESHDDNRSIAAYKTMVMPIKYGDIDYLQME